MAVSAQVWTTSDTRVIIMDNYKLCSPSAAVIWEGQVWRSEATGSWGECRDVVIVQIGPSKVRVRNLRNGIRTWITRDLFDNPHNYNSYGREFWPDADNLDDYFQSLNETAETVARLKQKIPPYEYSRLISTAKRA